MLEFLTGLIIGGSLALLCQNTWRLYQDLKKATEEWKLIKFWKSIERR